MRERAKILVGNREVAKRYLGSRLVWELSSALLRYEGTVYFREVYTFSGSGNGIELPKGFDNKFENQIKSVAFLNENKTTKIPIKGALLGIQGSFFLINDSDYDRLISKFGYRAKLTLEFYS